MTKKVLLGLAVVVLMFAGTNAWAQCEADETQSGYYCYTAPYGTVIIWAYNGPGGDVVIPDSIDGMSVTMIGIAAFQDRTDVTSVTVPDSVTLIHQFAFDGCTGLTSINIPDGVTSIGDRAFRDCSALTSITLPDSVTSIGSGAFLGCNILASVSIPDSVTSIGSGAFSGCSSLTSITIPDGVTIIEGSTFNGCSSLTSVTIPDSVTIIANFFAFRDCSSLTSLTIPDSVTSIGSYTFYGCSSLASITIPDSVTSMGDWAFYGCSSLASVTISNSVTRIGSAVFMNCTDLTSVVIPYSVTSIGASAFRSCTGLTSITIPDSVTSIGKRAFAQCASLTSVVIPDSVTSIEVGAFEDCSSLLTAYFIGNAPIIGASEPIIIGGDVFDNTAPDFSVCYTSEATGFTTPMWEGYPAAPCACSYDTDCAEDEICEEGVCSSLTDHSDIDSDGISDEEDNCPEIKNTNQADQDDDGIGDVCDSEPYFFWQTQIGQGSPQVWTLMEENLTFTNDTQAILWTTKDPDGVDDGLGWNSREGIAHSYVSYREVGLQDWSAETETIWIDNPGFIGMWSWVYPVLSIPANGDYEVKLISEDADGLRSEQVHTIVVAVP